MGRGSQADPPTPGSHLTTLWSRRSQILTVPSVKPAKARLSARLAARAWQVRPAQGSSALTRSEGAGRSHTLTPASLWPPVSRAVLSESSRQVRREAPRVWGG